MNGPEHYREAERLIAEQVRLDEELTDKLMSRDEMDAAHRIGALP